MTVERSLKFYVKILRAFGVFPAEVQNQRVLMTRKSVTMCAVIFAIGNSIVFFALARVLLNHERYYWRNYSQTGNIYRIFEMVALLLTSLVTHLWIALHYKHNMEALNAIFRIMAKVRTMHLGTSKYSLKSKILYYGYFVDAILCLVSMAALMFFIHKHKSDPDFVIEWVELAQRTAATMITNYTIGCVLAMSHCITCINDELSRTLIVYPLSRYLRLRKFQNLMEIYVTIEPICDQLNQVLGFPVAMYFCACCATTLSTALYLYIICFVSWTEISPLNKYLSLIASSGLIAPVGFSLAFLCNVNQVLKMEVSFSFLRLIAPNLFYGCDIECSYLVVNSTFRAGKHSTILFRYPAHLSLFVLIF